MRYCFENQSVSVLVNKKLYLLKLHCVKLFLCLFETFYNSNENHPLAQQYLIHKIIRTNGRTDGHTDTETDRHTQTNIQTHRQRDIHTNIQTNRQRQRDIDTNIQTNRQTHR